MQLGCEVWVPTFNFCTKVIIVNWAAFSSRQVAVIHHKAICLCHRNNCLGSRMLRHSKCTLSCLISESASWSAYYNATEA